MTPACQPPDYFRIKRVYSFQELISTPLENGVNALCWQRTLPGNFKEVVEHLVVEDDITPLDAERLNALPVSDEGRVAIAVLLEDQRLLRDHGLLPNLDCIVAYPRDEDPAVVPVDVYSFHADSAPVQADTYLCTYFGPSSEGLRNEEAQRRVDIPETRAELLKRYGGADDENFRVFLKENCYDLHYAPAPQARPYAFGLGNLWRIAVDYPGSPVPPCVHRAPETRTGQPPRLLLIS
jgi:hypothetical protein